jgi:NADPH:quinone reductase-like Zn-dependent oxidoreductase
MPSTPAPPEDHFAARPARFSFEQAAAVPISGFAALQVVRDNGQVQPGQRRRILSSTPRQEDLQTLRELLEAGKVTPLIDRTFPLAEVPQAFRQMVQGHGGGKVVITG